MDSLGLSKSARLSPDAREEMNIEGIRQGVMRSFVFAGAVLIATMVRLFLAMARANYVFLDMFTYDPYVLMWGLYIVLLAICMVVLWGLRRKGSTGPFTMVFSFSVQTLCLLVGITMAMSGMTGINVLPYTTCMMLFTIISTYSLGVTIPVLVAAHGVFIAVSLLLPTSNVSGAMIVDQTSVLAMAVASLIIVYMSRKNAFLNTRLTNELTDRNNELVSMNRRMKALMLVDEMTGVSNRRGFDRDIELSWQHCKRQDLSLVICLLDLDQFRLINEKFGRMAGNECLIAIAQKLIVSLKRSVDVVARLGGEEFAILLPFTDMEGGLIVADRIRAAVEEFVASYPRLTETGEARGEKEEARVTTSVGIAAGFPAHDRLPISELMRRAEYALRIAKQMGGNRVIPWKDPYEEEASEAEANA